MARGGHCRLMPEAVTAAWRPLRTASSNVIAAEQAIAFVAEVSCDVERLDRQSGRAIGGGLVAAAATHVTPSAASGRDPVCLVDGLGCNRSQLDDCRPARADAHRPFRFWSAAGPWPAHRNGPESGGGQGAQTSPEISAARRRNVIRVDRGACLAPDGACPDGVWRGPVDRRRAPVAASPGTTPQRGPVRQVRSSCVRAASRGSSTGRPTRRGGRSCVRGRSASSRRPR
jgi:hypothetical protein